MGFGGVTYIHLIHFTFNWASLLRLFLLLWPLGDHTLNQDVLLSMVIPLAYCPGALKVQAGQNRLVLQCSSSKNLSKICHPYGTEDIMLWVWERQSSLELGSLEFFGNSNLAARGAKCADGLRYSYLCKRLRAEHIGWPQSLNLTFGWRSLTNDQVKLRLEPSYCCVVRCGMMGPGCRIATHMRQGLREGEGAT